MLEREKRETENNVVIEGFKIQKENVENKIKKFFSTKLEFERDKIEPAWVSENIILADLGKEEKIKFMKKMNNIITWPGQKYL